MQKLKLLRKYLPSRLRAFIRYKQLLPELLKLEDLRIADQGYEGDLAWVNVSMENEELRFYGYPSDKVLKYVHRRLPHKIRSRISSDSLNIALDINRRYFPPLSKDECLEKGKFFTVQPGSTYVECGAFTGFHVMWISKIVGPRGKVIAIEAVPENFEILKKNIEYNQMENVKLINKAVWSTKKSLTFYRHQRQIGSAAIKINSGSFKVPADSVDHILSENQINEVDYVRIQVNGAEPEALMGMTDTLKKRPNLCIAALYNIDGHPAAGILESYLNTHGIRTKMKGNSLYSLRPRP